MKSVDTQIPEGFWETIKARIPNIYDVLEEYTSVYLS